MELKIVDGIDTEKSISELNEKEKEDIFTQMIKGKDVVGEIETVRGKFTVKFPKYKDSMAIARLMAFRRNNMLAETFDAVGERINLISSTLDIIVVDGPEWYKKIKEENKDFNFMEVPDDKFMEELYLKAYTFRSEVYKNLNEEEGAVPGRVPAGKGPEVTLADRPFEGLAQQFGNEGSE